MTHAELEQMARTRRLSVGARVRIPGLGEFVVEDQGDPSTITLRSSHGALARFGRLAVGLELEEAA
jgi:hypothetical protein